MFFFSDDEEKLDSNSYNLFALAAFIHSMNNHF